MELFLPILTIILYVWLVRQSSTAADNSEPSHFNLTKTLFQAHYEASNLCRVVDNDPVRVDMKDHYDVLEIFSSSPNKALVAKPKDSRYCFVAFAGTRPFSIRDWLSNVFPLGRQEICHAGQCCHVRKAFYNSFDTLFRKQLKESLRHCVETYCADDPSDCVILTGLSRGGAIASVAGLDWNEFHPQVVAFGTPLTLYPGCEIGNSTRWYRYINTRVRRNRQRQAIQLLYDPFPFLPGNAPVPFLPGISAQHRGHLLVISRDDPANLAYLGLDSQHDCKPVDWTLQAHFFGLVKNLRAVRDANIELYGQETDHIVSTAGFSVGALCSDDSVCASKKCSRENGFFSPLKCSVDDKELSAAVAPSVPSIIIQKPWDIAGG